MKRNILQVKENIHNVHGNAVELLNKVLPKYKEKLTLRCNVCNNIFHATYDNLVNKKSGCPFCAGHIKTTESFIKELVDLYGNKLLYTKVKYINARTSVTVICPKHGEFQRTPNKLLRGQGCTECRCSLLENLMMKELSKNNIQWEPQKRFKWLGKQSLDFYLPKYNIAIECQGEQHFHQVYFNGKHENIEKKNLFETIKKRDEYKYNKCKEHGIVILYFVDNKVITSEIKTISIYDKNYHFETDGIIKTIIKNEKKNY